MLLEKLVPSSLAAFGAGVKSSFFQNSLDRIAGDRPNAEFLEFAQDARVAPLVLLRQFENQLADLVGSPPSTRLGASLLAALFLRPNPLEQGIRRHDGRQLPKCLSGFWPKRTRRCRSFGVIVMRFGNLLRRISFSTLRYFTCLASSFSVAPAITSSRD